MISPKSAAYIPISDKSSARFKYVDRGYKDSIVLVPGWASDYRIFTTLDLRFNYLVPLDFSPFTFEEDLLVALKKNDIAKISIIGWSLGGFVAQEFALKYADLIDELILVSIRKRYEVESLKDIKRHLVRSKKGYLYKFYTQCFSKKDRMHYFRENLLRVYCEELDLDYLLKTLDYLENAEIKPQLLDNIKRITIIHGEYDRIAPVQEAIDIKDKIPHARFICIKDAGHIPFLEEDFKGVI
jgi:pimeloyl-ACP methyl ester carboxylesterase